MRLQDLSAAGVDIDQPSLNVISRATSLFIGAGCDSDDTIDTNDRVDVNPKQSPNEGPKYVPKWSDLLAATLDTLVATAIVPRRGAAAGSAHQIYRGGQGHSEGGGSNDES